MMIVDAPFGPQQSISLNGEYIETVSDFKYLGSMVASAENDAKIRKGQAWGAFWKLKNIWKATNIDIKLKIRLFEASCLSILLYGSETWILTEKMKQSLNSFATNCYRVMLDVKRTDHLTNEYVYTRVNQKPLVYYIIKRQLTWISHLLRIDKKEEPTRKYAFYEPRHEKSRQGRPALNFVKYISEMLGGASTTEIERAAQDRDGWYSIVLNCADRITKSGNVVNTLGQKPRRRHLNPG
jgi:hypothetical protein